MQPTSKSFSWRCLIAIAITLLLISNFPSAKARPRDGPKQNSLKEKFCDFSEEQQETCQKCAKITKSPLVYPMCCNDEEGVYAWCEDYVNFGHEPTSVPRRT